MEDQGDVFTFENLGGGQEVGRSCHILQFKGKCVMVTFTSRKASFNQVVGCGRSSGVPWLGRTTVL